jgi:hypothetical protein
MTITNKSLAKQLAKTIKMFDVKLWEVSGAKRKTMISARTKTWEALSALGYQLQSDYTLITNSVNSMIESVDLPQDEEYPSKTVQIVGHTVTQEKNMTLKEKLEKELRRLQRDLNSQRLSTYILGDTSDNEIARQKERSSKLERFNEVLVLLRKID